MTSVYEDISGRAWVTSGELRNQHMLLTLLQVRVRPRSYTEHPNAMYTPQNPRWADPLVRNEVIEWRVANPADVTPYRVVQKVLTIDEYHDQRGARWPEGSPGVRRIGNPASGSWCLFT
jgi:hypothetical protein